MSAASISDERLVELQREAEADGDNELACLCLWALAGSLAARKQAAAWRDLYPRKMAP